jgi:isopenicillin-N epimerase
MQHLLKPLVVSWGYESETPGTSPFVDLHEWWGTRDISAFLSVPTAIKFQQEHDWGKVRLACHELVKEAQARICKLTELPPIHSDDDSWFAQLAAAPLPDNTDIVSLKSRLYDEYRVEIPLTTWGKKKLIRVSIQGYNTRKDVDKLVEALSALL